MPRCWFHDLNPDDTWRPKLQRTLHLSVYPSILSKTVMADAARSSLLLAGQTTGIKNGGEEFGIPDSSQTNFGPSSPGSPSSSVQASSVLYRRQPAQCPGPRRPVLRRLSRSGAFETIAARFERIRRCTAITKKGKKSQRKGRKEMGTDRQPSLTDTRQDLSLDWAAGAPAVAVAVAHRADGEIWRSGARKTRANEGCPSTGFTGRQLSSSCQGLGMMRYAPPVLWIFSVREQDGA